LFIRVAALVCSAKLGPDSRAKGFSRAREAILHAAVVGVVSAADAD
jgi:hypothetical protein